MTTKLLSPPVLSNNHWLSESYSQRMTVREWRQVLLRDGDHIFVKGELRALKVRALGSGVVEIFKEALKS